jgi:hypothetical protein
MSRLLRGVLWGGADEDQRLLIDNYHRLVTSGVTLDPLDSMVLEYITAHVEKHGEVPGVGLVADTFLRSGRVELADRVKEIGEEPLYISGDFRQVVLDARTDQDKQGLTELLREANIINTTGKTIGKELRKGVKDALSHVMAKATLLLRADSGEKLSGEVREDADEVVQEYFAAKNGRNNSPVIYTGFDPLDEIWGGIRKKEVMFWLGFTNQGKSTCCLNIAYNAMVYQGANVLIYSLEMSYQNVRRMLYTIHSANPKFTGNDPVSYDDVEAGTLTEEEEEFFLNTVIPDFHDMEDSNHYGTVRVMYPGPGFTVAKLRMDAEMQHRQKEVHLLVVDYVQLMSPEAGVKFADRREGMNQLMKDIKTLAMTFNDGEGVGILSPYQANRDGYKQATNNDGVYELYAMSEYSESEKSADCIASGYLNDELKADHEMICAGIKHRNKPTVPPFRLATKLASRYVGVGSAESPVISNVLDLSDINF